MPPTRGRTGREGCYSIPNYIAKRTAHFQTEILDTGIRHNHPDLAANINGALSHNWADDTDVWTDHQGHGTLIAGAANAIVDNGLGAAGIAPKCRSYPWRLPLERQQVNGNPLAGIVNAMEIFNEMNGKAQSRRKVS